MDKRSLAGYSPWGCKESDTTERTTHRQFQDSLVLRTQSLFLALFTPWGSGFLLLLETEVCRLGPRPLYVYM